MSHVRPEVFTNNNPSNTILVTYSTARFWVCGFTNHADLSNLHQAVPYMTEVKGLLIYAMYPENAKSMFAPMCHICTMCHAFKMQPELHNSVAQGISKVVYLRLCLVFCSSHDRPPGLVGHEVILTFTYRTYMFNAFTSLFQQSFQK